MSVFANIGSALQFAIRLITHAAEIERAAAQVQATAAGIERLVPQVQATISDANQTLATARVLIEKLFPETAVRALPDPTED